jgi:hypothetical protein
MSSRLIYLRIVDKTRSHPHRASECPVPQRPRAIPLVPTSTLPSLPDPSRAPPPTPTTSRIPARPLPVPRRFNPDTTRPFGFVYLRAPTGSSKSLLAPTLARSLSHLAYALHVWSPSSLLVLLPFNPLLSLRFLSLVPISSN